MKENSKAKFFHEKSQKIFGKSRGKVCLFAYLLICLFVYLFICFYFLANIFAKFSISNFLFVVRINMP